MQTETAVRNKAMKAPRADGPTTDADRLRAKGWLEIPPQDAPVPYRNWRDPLCVIPGGWFYSLDDAIGLQKERDSKS